MSFLNKDTLEIINGSAHEFGGHKIRFIVDKSLQVQNIAYIDWSDDLGYININTVLEISSFELNKNPFKEGIEGLSGKFSFLRRNDGYGNSSAYLAGTHPQTFFYETIREFSCK